MWANAQREGRSAEYIWRPVNIYGAKMQKPLKFAGVPQTRQQISAVISRRKFTILSGHVEEVLLFNKLFFRLSIHALVPKI